MIYHLNTQPLPKSLLVSLDVEPKKNIVLVIDLNSSPKISFHPLTSTDLYRVSNFQVFAKYFDSVFHRPHREITIVIAGCNLRSMLNTLSLIYSIFSVSSDTTTSFSTVSYQAKFTDAYRYYISQIHPSNAASTVNPTIGENDRPVPFNLVFVMNLANLSDVNNPAPSTITQQFVRFLALKHGGLIIVTPNVDHLLANPESILSFKPDTKPVFHLHQHPPSDKSPCDLYIPLAWDSWSKIIILGKSASSHRNRWDSLETLLQVNSEYNDILESSSLYTYQGLIGDLVDRFDPEFQSPPPDLTVLTLDDILAAATDH